MLLFLSVSTNSLHCRMFIRNYLFWLFTMLWIVPTAQAQPLNGFYLSGRLSMGGCMSAMHNDSLIPWNQKVGGAANLEGYFTYRRADQFSVSLGGGFNYFQFSYTQPSYQYNIAYYGLKSELILRKFFTVPSNSNLYFFGCGLGFSFHGNDRRVDNNSGFTAVATSYASTPFFFAPQIGFSQPFKRSHLSLAFQVTINPAAVPFLHSEIYAAQSGARMDYKGNYAGITIIYDWRLNNKVRPPKPEKVKPEPENHPVPEVFTEREHKFLNEIHLHKRRITVWVWDHGTIDNDTISLELNNQIVLSEYRLVREKKKVKVKLQKGNNELILLAHNEGDLPPNSCAVIIRSGFRKQKLILNSTLRESEGVRLIYE